MEAGFQEMRGEGIGKLVGLAFPDNHGIAIHYSYPSIHGAWIVDGQIKERVTYRTSPTFDRFNENLDGWLKILRDAGLQFDFMAYSAVEKGELISKGYKTFILPMSVALSDEEIQAIREFVLGGGTVIADALPGVMDEHCRFRKSQALEELFGIKAPLADRERIIAMQGEPGLKLKAARALLTEGKQPILTHNNFGQGQAWLLNYFLDSYSRDKREGRSGPALEKMNKVLYAAGIEPKVRLSSLAGNPVTDCDRYLFDNGSTKLLGLVPDIIDRDLFNYYHMHGSLNVHVEYGYLVAPLDQALHQVRADEAGAAGDQHPQDTPSDVGGRLRLMNDLRPQSANPNGNGPKHKRPVPLRTRLARRRPSALG